MGFSIIHNSHSTSSVFNTALPYGAATLAVGAVGATLALTASSTIATFLGIAVGLCAAYAFMGVIACALASRDAKQFEENIGKTMITFGSIALADIISLVVQRVLINFVDNLFHKNH